MTSLALATVSGVTELAEAKVLSSPVKSRPRKVDRRTPAEKAADVARMDRLRARRDELAKADPSKKGGRPRKREPVTSEEVRERAREESSCEQRSVRELLAPYRADAVSVLVSQLHARNENVAQRAARVLLEFTDGRPAQTIVEKQDAPKRIIFETAALLTDAAPTFVPGAGSALADEARAEECRVATLENALGSRLRSSDNG